jgi:hypothetical protein
MSFNVQTFQSNIDNRGLVQSNKYDITISLDNTELSSALLKMPTNGGSIYMSDMCKDLSYRCIAAEIPTVEIRAASINRYGLGVVEQIPFTTTPQQLSITFLCDRIGGVYNFWTSWLNYILSMNGLSTTNQTKTNQLTTNGQFYTLEYKTNYSATIAIAVYDNGGNITNTHKYYGAFPIIARSSPIGWGTNNDLLKLNVSISFREYQIDQSTIS